MRGMAGSPTPEIQDMYRLMLVEQFKGREAIVQAAKKAGVEVTDAQIEEMRDKKWNESVRSAIASQLGIDPKSDDRTVEEALQKMNPDSSISVLKQNVIEADQLRNELYYNGLKAKVAPPANIDAAYVKRTYSDIQVRHVLIKSGPGGLPDDQAKAKAEKVLAEAVKDPASLAKLAKENSDDPGSKAKGGLYDWAPGSQYVPEFTQGSLAAGLGKVNPSLVKTTYGYHIVKLEGERPGKTLPKDFDKESAKYVQQYVDRIAQAKVGEVIAAEQPKLTVEILDPGMRAAMAIREAGGPNKNGKLAEALTELDKIPASEDPLGSVPLRKAGIYEQLGKLDDAVKSLELALRGRNLPETRFKLAALLVKTGKKDSVKEQLQEIEKLALSSPDQWKQLGDLYRQIGDKENETRALLKNQEMTKRQQALQKQQQKAAAPTQAPTPAPAPKK
jgi:parvulin-like peptidyl-prolyl isomerase